MVALGTKEVVCNIAHSKMENNIENKLNNYTKHDEVQEKEEEEVWLSLDF